MTDDIKLGDAIRSIVRDEFGVVLEARTVVSWRHVIGASIRRELRSFKWGTGYRLCPMGTGRVGCLAKQTAGVGFSVLNT